MENQIEHFQELAIEVARVKDPRKVKAALFGLERRMVSAKLSRAEQQHVASYFAEVRKQLREAGLLC